MSLLLDISILVILVASAFSSMRHGLIKAIFLFVGLIVGWVLAGQYADDLGRQLADSLGSASAATVLSYLIILIASIIASNIAAGILTPMLSAGTLGFSNLVNSLGGLALGLLFGLAISGILVAGLARLGHSSYAEEETIESLQAAIIESRLANIVLDISGPIPGLIPDFFGDAVDALQTN